ncbi:cytochrome P450 monooxygenase [Fusarium mundagurra]|uniref:Cytochrome P450 monooxygenase n=1 Tax=Fusarium mundagurra TaxID=1567541 RepID=A0A8H5Z340_9HYPO|nr:cytochrome P450 monooxygenase [Fusarium mundagurra]
MSFVNNEVLVSWTGLILGLVLLIVPIALHRRYFSNLSDIPGPFWASVTRLWHVWIILEGKQNLRLKALHRKHGQFVRIAPDEVSVCHPNGSQLILGDDNLHKGDWYRVTAVPDCRFQNPMSTTDPKKKKAVSRHFAPAYTLSQVLKKEPDVNKNIEDLLRWVEKHAQDRVPMDLDKFITYTTFDNIGSALFSEPFGFIRAGRDIGGTLRNNVALSRFAAVAGFFIGPLRILINPLNSWLVFLPMGRLYRTTSNAIKKRLSNPEAHNDMVAHWLSAHEKSDTLSLRKIEAQANVNVGAGAEPVSSAIQSLLYHLIQHPEAWLRVRNEIDAAKAEGSCLGRVVSYRDAEKLTYLRACIKEALLMFSPTTMGLARVVPKGGVNIAGRHFQEGTILSISPNIVHSSKVIWGDDADQWNPERWMSGDAKKLDKDWIVAVILRGYKFSK